MLDMTVSIIFTCVYFSFLFSDFILYAIVNEAVSCHDSTMRTTYSTHTNPAQKDEVLNFDVAAGGFYTILIRIFPVFFLHSSSQFGSVHVAWVHGVRNAFRLLHQI